MKKILTLLFLFVSIITYCQQDSSFIFTKEEVIKLDSLIQVYEQRDSIQQKEIILLYRQLDNYKLLSQNDSLHINLLIEQNTFYQERINLYADLTEELKPKWYEKPIVSFIGGVFTVGFSSWVLSNIK